MRHETHLHEPRMQELRSPLVVPEKDAMLALDHDGYCLRLVLQLGGRHISFSNWWRPGAELNGVSKFPGCGTQASVSAPTAATTSVGIFSSFIFAAECSRRERGSTPLILIRVACSQQSVSE